MKDEFPRAPIGDPPADLSDEARAKWLELVAPGVWGGVVTAADADALAEYCRLYVRKAKADKAIAEFGELVTAPNGFPSVNPWLAIANQCRRDMQSLRASFGGTPSTRGRVGRAKVAEGAALDIQLPEEFDIEPEARVQ